jgi:hypothetical protein
MYTLAEVAVALDWIMLQQAAARLADKHPLPGTAHELTENAVKSGKLSVRGIGRGMGLWKASYEVIPAHLLIGAHVNAFLCQIELLERWPGPMSWMDVQVQWKEFIAYIEQNLLPAWIDVPRATGGKQTTQEAVRAYIDETYQGHIPSGVTNKEIARATGVNERTVRRARGRK